MLKAVFVAFSKISVSLHNVFRKQPIDQSIPASLIKHVIYALTKTNLNSLWFGKAPAPLTYHCSAEGSQADRQRRESQT